MTTERDFDRIAVAWLADGPEELSERVIDAAVDQIHLTRQRRAIRAPWRLPTMTMHARVAALVAAGVLILAGVAVVGTGGGRTGPSPTQAPTPSVAAAVPSARPSEAVDLLPLDRTFNSPLNGYSIGTLPSWTVTPATKGWTSTIPDSAFMDGFDVTSAVSVGAMSQPLGSRTFDEFLDAFYRVQHTTLAGGGCDDGGAPSTWPTVPIGDQIGRLEVVCSLASDEALVAVGGRVYLFELGRQDPSFPLSAFKQMLRTVTFDPATADLTKTFKSPLYGYSVPINAAWTTTPATKAWRDHGNSSDFMDGVGITADTGFGAMSQALNGRTFDDFVHQFYEGQLAAIGPNCAGGDPSAWADVQVGDQTGKLEIQCGSDEALVQSGDRVYLFELGTSSSTEDRNLSPDSWKNILRRVTFDPAAAKN